MHLCGNNGNSKRYIESILKIANITTFDNTVNPAAVDDLNREEQELLYRMLMIDRYLKNIDFEEPSDVIDYISVNLKRKNEIRLSIIETASAVTPEFFISYYENNTSTFNDIGIGDIEFKENEYFDDSEEHDDCQYEIDPDEYEETLLANILHIPEGEAYRFEHKNIHMQTIIDCEGKLEFRNCIIHYGENNQVAEIMVKLNGSISMKNCTIEGHSYFKENAFITAESEEFASEFENCTFRNCCSFLRTSYAFSLQGCEVINPGLNFIEERYSHHKNHGLIQNTKFTYNNIPTFVQQSLDGNYGSIISAEQLIFSHCSVIGLLEINSAENAEQIKNSVPTFIRTDKVTMDHILCNGISYFFRGCGEIIHSEFKECNIILSSIFHTERFIVKDCSFEKCTEIGNSLHKTNFVHCQFNCCYNRLISSSGAGDTSIEFCEFNQWSAEKKHGTKYPEIIPHAMIEFSRSKGKNNGSNVIKNCTFNKMIAHRYFVILGKVYEDIGDYVAYVENCNFVNCTTERDSGKIIKEYDHYLGLFKKRRDVKTISIASTCRGLDQVKKV